MTTTPYASPRTGRACLQDSRAFPVDDPRDARFTDAQQLKECA
ncbi:MULTISPECIES: hypothetical protein [unclassified Kosakonia]|nr:MULTISPECIES: hypothetical protein [unclassified Kosakonia]